MSDTARLNLFESAAEPRLCEREEQAVLCVHRNALCGVTKAPVGQRADGCENNREGRLGAGGLAACRLTQGRLPESEAPPRRSILAREPRTARDFVVIALP